MDRKLFDWNDTMMGVMTTCILAFLTGTTPVLVVTNEGIVMGVE